jgi:hypothetical protein
MELKLDIDGNKKNLHETLYRIRLSGKILERQWQSAKVYSTKRGWHVYLETGLDISNKEAILLQVLLNSDWIREAYNLKRLWAGNTTNWNVLFDVKKDSNGKILSEEKYYCSINYGRKKA